jgi:DNA-binding CsgD family transcriptional regulator
MCLPLDRKLAAAMADVLDGLSVGMFLVDADGRIVHANAAGQVVLAAADVLCCAAGRLTAPEEGANKSLHKALAAAGNDNTKAAALSLTAPDGTRYVACVLPLIAGARRRAGTAYAATAAIFLNEAALNARPFAGSIAETYRLTPTELRILLAIVEVGGVPEVAEAVGIAESTVKTHLGHLFEKTGTSRQADLVKLVAGFSNSLVR